MAKVTRGEDLIGKPVYVIESRGVGLSLSEPDMETVAKWVAFEFNGSPSKFERIASEIGKLVTEKNLAYGDSFARSGEILKVLYPAGIRPEQYVDALGVIRVIDKLFRIATDKHALGESPWRDVAGYGVLGVANDPQRGAQ